jgi:hypothetical protein
MASPAAAPSVQLVWTATGDDAETGRASGYDLRYSTTPVFADTAAWWNAATLATGLPRPSSAGQEDSAIIRGLRAETTYYFVLCVYDAAANQSAFSNVAMVTTGLADSLPEPQATPLHAYPNPAHDLVRFVIHVEGISDQWVKIRLFDPSGRVVADIADALFPVGDTILSWPRVTVHGDRVAPGYYESIGTIGTRPVRERLILLP